MTQHPRNDTSSDPADDNAWPFAPDPELEGVEAEVEDLDDEPEPFVVTKAAPVVEESVPSEPPSDRPDVPPARPRASGADEAADGLAQSAVFARYGLIVVAVLVVASRLRGGVGLAFLAEAEAIVLFGVIAGRVSGNLLRASAAALRLLADTGPRPEGVEAAPPATPVETPDQQRTRRAAEVRRAIRAGQWGEAELVLSELADQNPDDPRVLSLRAEFADEQASAAIDLRARLDAAREANDAERLIELRDALAPLLAHDEAHALDRELARWFFAALHRRLRGGTVQVDFVTLAGRVAASLENTPEGASLVASLPTLRRAAGLCPRCARPYKGIARACPACLTSEASAAKSRLPDNPPAPTNGNHPDRPADHS